MRAARFHGVQNVKIDRIEEPKAKKGQVKLKVSSALFRCYVPNLTDPTTRLAGMHSYFTILSLIFTCDLEFRCGSE